MRWVHCLLLAFCDRIVDEELVQFLSVAFRFDNPPAADLRPACWFMVSRRAIAPVAACGEATKPVLSPIGSLSLLRSIDTVATHFLAQRRTMQT
jgi:hypothetical protein